jgi:hypothetical protein
MYTSSNAESLGIESMTVFGHVNGNRLGGPMLSEQDKQIADLAVELNLLERPVMDQAISALSSASNPLPLVTFLAQTRRLTPLDFETLKVAWRSRVSAKTPPTETKDPFAVPVGYTDETPASKSLLATSSARVSKKELEDMKRDSTLQREGLSVDELAIFDVDDDQTN